MKFLSFLFLIVIIITSCEIPTENNNMDYSMKYYYRVGNSIFMNYIFISEKSDVLAYKAACDSFLNRTKAFIDTVKKPDPYNIIPQTFTIDRALDSLNMTAEMKDHIYSLVNDSSAYSDIDTSTLYKWSLKLKPRKPPLIIVRSWISHNSINTPEANIVVKNTTKRTINGVKVSIECYNNFGERITYGFNNVFNGISQDRLGAGHSDTYTWTLNLFDNTTKITPSIMEVHFSDGSNWVY